MNLFRTGLSSRVTDNLRPLDPVQEHDIVTDAQLQQMAFDLVGREQTPGLSLDITQRQPRSHRRAWAAVGSAAAAVLVVGIAIAAIELRPAERTPAPAGPMGGALGTMIPPHLKSLAHQTNPLSAGMHVDCNGVAVPVPELAAPGGAERQTSASSNALRRFLAHNPFQGMGTVTTKNWLLLARTKNTLTFGQREGPIGVGSVVTLTRRGSSFEATGEGGCSPVIPGPGQAGEPVQATADGADLILHWENGSNCGTGPAKTDRTLAGVLLKQTPTAIHVLLISKPSPDAGRLPANQACTGVGLSSTTRVHLNAPLAARTVIDDARIPAATVHVGR